VRRTLILVLSSLVLWSYPTARAQSPCATCSVPSLAQSPAPSPRGAGPAESELKALDAEIDQAFLRGDRAALAALLDDSLVLVGGFDEVGSKAQILEQMQPRKGPMKTTISSSDVVVAVSGDSAVVTSKKTRTTGESGAQESSRYRDTNGYARRGGKWRLISSQTSYEDPPYVAKDVSFDLDFDPAAALGDGRAQVVVYEFSDYECPMCRHFAAETFPRFEKDYVRTGRVALVFRDNPLTVHPRAASAAAAGACAETFGKRWPMTERLLRDPVALSDDDFRRHAREIGIESAGFERCVSDPATAGKIRQGLEEAKRLGVKGTPIFLIGVRRPEDRRVRAVRKIEGALPYEVFQATLDGVLRARGL